MNFSILKIVTGGQTGVDRAALDFGRKNNIPVGGWCPKGRIAEDGIIPDCYPLKETITEDYSERTELNVRDSDGTLILLENEPVGGTLLTIEKTKEYKKPCFILKLPLSKDLIDEFIKWIKDNKIEVLNIGGPRESQEPGIYELSLKSLNRLFEALGKKII